jgi:hypothetical protein
MGRRLSRPFVVLTLLAGLGLWFPSQSATGQTVSEDQVKAAYLYNFAKFVEWPTKDYLDSHSAIRLCVLADAGFEAELKKIVLGKTIASRPVMVMQPRRVEESRDCHILFIGSSQGKEAEKMIAALHDASVLTVGETNDFVQKGGMITFILQDDRVQFQVNHKVATRAGVHISARLLSVARLVIE